MSDPETTITEGALRFFGRISASISHELKNVLAIINENAGLVDDLALLAASGAPADPERLQQVSERIGRQVQRADRILKNMNAFSHSVDEPVRTMDLGTVVSLVVALSERFAAKRQVALEAGSVSSGVSVETSPILLKHLVFQCLEFAMDRAGENGTLEIGVGGGGAGEVEVTIRGLKELGREPAETSLGKEHEPLLGALRARVTTDETSQTLVLSIIGKER